MSTLQIRMYNVGFGDCFLLTLPGKRTILVDAGFHSQGKGAFDGNGLVKQIVKDLKAVKGEARIDVVIATHRHQDHVYAFNSDEWDQVAVGEVWLPWVEDRSNTQATGLWKKQKQFALQLAAAVPSFQLSAEDQKSVDWMLWNAGVDIPAFADAGGWSNKAALDRLHEGFARRDRQLPRFLPEKLAFPDVFETALLPGVRVHVLGPARNPDQIEELDPEHDGETYRALALRAAPLMNGGASALPPFGDSWRVGDDEDGAGFVLQNEETDRLHTLAQGVDALFAATKLDGMINSTSLVLLLEVGNARLLLPGDAEWGTWKRILDHDEARTLLRGATFLKVGHHGSHNATSKTLVEAVLPRRIPALISTQQGAGQFRNDIPLPDLLTALEGRAIRFVRSDATAQPLPQGFTKGAGEKWVDLELDC